MAMMILAFMGIAVAGMLIGGDTSDADTSTDATDPPVNGDGGGETGGDGLDEMLGGETDPEVPPEETPEEPPVPHSADSPHATTVTVTDPDGVETVSTTEVAPDWNGDTRSAIYLDARVIGTDGDDRITVEGDARAYILANDGADTIQGGLGHIIAAGADEDRDEITITIDQDTLTDHPELREAIVFMDAREDAVTIALDDNVDGFVHRIDTEIDVHTGSYSSDSVRYESDTTSHYTHYVLTDSATPPSDDFTLVDRRNEDDERIFFEESSFGGGRILATVYTGRSILTTEYVYFNDAETEEVIVDEPYYDTTPPEIFINRAIASTQTADPMRFNGYSLAPRA